MGPVIGITGPAGAGKTFLASALGERGFPVLSLDKLGHGLLENEDIKERLVETFSTAILRITDGALSREKLSRMVFSDKRDMEKLNRIVHPPLAEKAAQWIEDRRSAGERGVVEGALIYELGLDRLLDGVILADAPFETRLRRLETSRGWDRDRLSACDASQIPPEDKLARGAVRLDSDAPPPTVLERLLQVLREKNWLSK